jgi:hypothetical protein
MKKIFLAAMTFCLFGALAGAAALLAGCATTGAAALDDVIAGAAREICKNLPKGAQLAIVNFNSDSEKVSGYIMEELTYAFAEQDVEVADRTNLPFVRQELQLQAQGWGERQGRAADREVSRRAGDNKRGLYSDRRSIPVQGNGGDRGDGGSASRSAV